MLAYVFWHEPLGGVEREEYEHAHVAFHRSLAHRPPVGLLGSAAFRVRRPPWLRDGDTSAYEDWYVLEDYAALGVLGEAAVGRGHQSAHDAVARRYGGGAGALYGLIEGASGARAIGGSSLAVWIERPLGAGAAARRRGLDELLGDGMDAERASLWRRQLVLGPSPELCLLAEEAPAGVAPTRLPAGWSATALAREALTKA
ncbi:MAG TPA: hypothetical protein VL979_01010 [Solirubrobacteraceae bacterium]|nr:hypothetical protein [Solirubrobacteraceae bacterium]